MPRAPSIDAADAATDHAHAAGLSLRGVRHRWPGASAPVLQDIALDVRPGDLAWVGGRNGIGKTTLLRIAAGILLPQVGRVRLTGLDPVAQRSAYGRATGFLSAGDRGLTARLTVAQQLDLAARLSYVPRVRRADSVRAVAAVLGLADRVDQRVDRLSQGWRQRVRIGMAVVHRPQLLLLDEPGNSLDDDGLDVLSHVVEAARGSGACVVWCSPRAEDAPTQHATHHELADGRLERIP